MITWLTDEAQQIEWVIKYNKHWMLVDRVNGSDLNVYVDGAWKPADDVLFRRNDEVKRTRISVQRKVKRGRWGEEVKEEERWTRRRGKKEEKEDEEVEEKEEEE